MNKRSLAAWMTLAIGSGVAPLASCQLIGGFTDHELAPSLGSGGGEAAGGQTGSGAEGQGGSATAVCGNKVVEPGEACDDGNASDSDGCLPTCTEDVTWTEGTFPALEGDVMNPERGFYHDVDLVGGGDATHVRSVQQMTLAFGLVRLDAFRSAPLSEAFFTNLNAGFARVRAAGIKMVLRFAYNRADAGADAPMARVLEHIGALAPVFAENQDVIAVIQAGFIGAYGEWHSSTNDLDTTPARAEILKALLAALPPSRLVEVRTPAIKDALFPGGPLAEAEAFTGTDRARTGHHNDCFLASDSDFGTYSEPVEQWKGYVASDGRFTSVGGETCSANPPRSECFEAVKELETLHWSYLNSIYSPEVINGFKSGGCYDEIRARLGYRVALDGAKWTGRVRPGGALGLHVRLTNTGFAAMINPRSVYVVLSNGVTRLTAKLESADPRRWDAGASTSIAAWLRVPATVTPGEYRLALWLPDAAPSIQKIPEYAVRFANSGTWDPATGDNLLTTGVTVDDAAPGATDPGATELAEIR